jgi:hypothetical protein
VVCVSSDQSRRIFGFINGRLFARDQNDPAVAVDFDALHSQAGTHRAFDCPSDVALCERLLSPWHRRQSPPNSASYFALRTMTHSRMSSSRYIGRKPHRAATGGPSLRLGKQIFAKWLWLIGRPSELISLHAPDRVIMGLSGVERDIAGLPWS